MNEPTRIAFCTEVLAEYKLHLHHRLAARPGYEVVVWHGPSRRGKLPADVDPGGAFPHRSARNLHFSLGLPAVWQRLHRELWAFRPHVVILEDGVRLLSNWRVLVEARRRGVPVILYSHGENRMRARTRGRWLGEGLELLRRSMHERAQALVLYTEASAAAYRARFPDRACFVATNTLDLEAMAAQIAALPDGERARQRAEWGVGEGALLLASVGRMIAEHDPRPLLAGVRRARAEGLDVHLLLVGGGPLESEARRFVDGLAPGERGAFHLLPKQPLAETTRRLVACDAFVLPGTIGLGIVHAFAAGLPAIATPQGLETGPEWSYLEHGRNGLLVDDLGDAFVRALGQLAREPARLRALADGAARYAREQLSPERQAQGFFDAIDFVLQRSNRDERSPAAFAG